MPHFRAIVIRFEKGNPSMAYRMTRPGPALFWMALFTAALAVLLWFVREPLVQAFQANPGFNALIVGVLLVGVAVICRQVFALYGEATWIEEFRRRNPERSVRRNTRLLAPMSRMLASHDGHFTLSTGSLGSLLDGIRSRLDDSRDVARYMIGLLIFLGLLGTFWGLLITIGDVAQVIRGLDAGGADSMAVFDRLKTDLEGPLSGMAVAFSSSLFGLAGSLILGFFDLQAGHAQNRFYNELEEWLSSVTRLSSGALPDEAGSGAPAYVQALLEQTADGLEKMQREMVSQHAGRDELQQQLAQLNRSLADLSRNLDRSSIDDDLRQELRLLNRTIAAALKSRPETLEP